MQSFDIPKNPQFVGREDECKRLSEIVARPEAKAIVVFGRRRVGKTELIEQFFRERKILKFEGVERESPRKSKQAMRYQIGRVLSQLAVYADAPHIAQLNFKTWGPVFELLASFLKRGSWVLYFEEIQWLANYQSDFFSEFKPVWDNILRHNRELVVVFCGSSPSFLMSQMLSDKAFYNRATDEIHLREFNHREARAFLGKNRALFEVMLAMLTVGGIPEYLKRLKGKTSVFLSLCEQSFLPRSFFSIEKNKIFVSSLSASPNFEKVIQFLSLRKYATRDEIATALRLKTGGGVTALLDELETCGFIERYTPFYAESRSLIARYAMADPYLYFYYKFIASKLKKIENGDFKTNPAAALETGAFHKWLGFSFERFCRKNHLLIATLLGFSGVAYRAGAFFHRSTSKEYPGFQIDLVFDRADHVLTVCEMKYHQAPVDARIIAEMEQKIDLLKRSYRRAATATISRVLIAPLGADPSLLSRAYFDRVITLEDLFKGD